MVAGCGRWRGRRSCRRWRPRCCWGCPRRGNHAAMDCERGDGATPPPLFHVGGFAGDQRGARHNQALQSGGYHGQKWASSEGGGGAMTTRRTTTQQRIARATAPPSGRAARGLSVQSSGRQSAGQTRRHKRTRSCSTIRGRCEPCFCRATRWRLGEAYLYDDFDVRVAWRRSMAPSRGGCCSIRLGGASGWVWRGCLRRCPLQVAASRPCSSWPTTHEGERAYRASATRRARRAGRHLPL